MTEVLESPTESTTPEPPITSLPYAERQFIVVLPDDIHRHLHKAATGEDNGLRLPFRGDDDDPKREENNGNLPAYVTKMIGVQRKMHERGSPLRFVSLVRASELRFNSPGHPLYNHVYIGHPVTPDLYYTAADFNRRILLQRYWELFSLLCHLGATKIRVESRDADKKLISLGLPMVKGVGVAVSVGVKKEKEDSSVLEATLPGDCEPGIPENSIWFHYEETWQALVAARLNAGLSTFDLTIAHSDNFGITAGLAGELKDAKFSLGGEFSDLDSVLFRLSGEFAPITRPSGLGTSVSSNGPGRS